jgi:hypothetical protein
LDPREVRAADRANDFRLTLRGYVIARIVFTLGARALSEFPVDPQALVLDETLWLR